MFLTAPLLLISAFVCTIIVTVLGITGENQKLSKWSGDPDLVNYQSYYYTSVRGKMTESLSVSNCTVSGAALGKKLGDRTADLQVQVLRPKNQEVWAKWGYLTLDRTKELRKSLPVYFQMNAALCNSDRFRDFRKGFYKRAKGCFNYSMYMHLPYHRRPINKYHATLHPNHIRCNNEIVVDACRTAVKAPAQIPYFARQLNDFPFIVDANEAIVARSGMIGLECGPFGLFASCEAFKEGIVPLRRVMPDFERCRNERDCPYPVHRRVFIMTQYDDTQIGQFVLEDMPKLILHLDWLRQNPDVMIHFGFNKQYEKVGSVEKFVLPHHIFDWLGLRDRLVNDTIYTKQAFIPREGGCQDVGYNIWEILNMRETVLKWIEVDNRKLSAQLSRLLPTSAYYGVESKVGPYTGPGNKKVIIILQRSASEFTRNQDRARRWSDQKLLEVVSAFSAAFGNRYIVVIYSDKNVELMKCHICQAKLFSEASIVVGLHGAGLTNTLYMKPQGVVVEIIPWFDARHAPITGIFPRLSSILGLHHYTYQIEDQSVDRVINAENLASDTSIFVNNIIDPFTGEAHAIAVQFDEAEVNISELITPEMKAKEEALKKYKIDSLGIDYGG